ncbi:MAG: hypothetical protein R3A78_08275 [Polyangiales bacterium]
MSESGTPNALVLRLPWNAERLLFVLFSINLALLLIDLYLFQIEPSEERRWLFDMNLEANVPTWFSATQEFAVAVAAWVVVVHHQRVGNTFARWAWTGIAAFFLLIAIDDASEMHERLATLWSADVKASDGTSVIKDAVQGFASYYWQLFFMPFFATAGALMAWFLWRQLGGLRGWLFYAGIAFYANAVLLDYFDPFTAIYDALAVSWGIPAGRLQHYFRDTEEFLEVFGTSCILVSFLQHYASLATCDEGGNFNPQVE